MKNAPQELLRRELEDMDLQLQSDVRATSERSLYSSLDTQVPGQKQNDAKQKPAAAQRGS